MSETKQPTEEELKVKREDLESRIKSFNAELIPLLGKYKLGLGAEPQYARTPEGVYVTVARPTILDDNRVVEKATEEVAKVE